MIFESYIENLGLSLEEFIKDDNFQIIFGDIESVDEFNINIKDEGFKISIRNKYENGASSKEIPHDPTIKIIAGSKFKKDGMLGLPITISDKPKIYKDCDNKYNRTQARPYMKATKKFIKDNKKELEEYWGINPSTIKGSKRLKELENVIRSKYE